MRELGERELNREGRGFRRDERKEGEESIRRGETERRRARVEEGRKEEVLEEDK